MTGRSLPRQRTSQSLWSKKRRPLVNWDFVAGGIFVNLIHVLWWWLG